MTLSKKMYSSLPAPLKSRARDLRRFVHSRMHPSYPRVFLNSIPKAGTHLLTTLLERMGYLLYWNQPFNPDLLLDYATSNFRPHLQRVLPGEYIVEHLPWQKSAEEIFSEFHCRIVFVYRDPRASAVSFARYVGEQHRHHRLHRYFASLPDLDSRVRATLDGIPDEKSKNGHGRPAHGVLYDSFLPWKHSESAFSISFEALVGERGGGSAEEQRNAVRGFFTHLGIKGDDEKIRRVAESVFNEQSATFRSAQIDGWRREVSPDTAALLDASLKKQISQWGYS